MAGDREFGDARRFQLFGEFRPVQPEQRSERGRRFRPVFDGVGADEHRIGGAVVRKNDAVAVFDGSAGGDDRDLPRPLPDRTVAQFFALHDLHDEKPAENEQKKKDYRHRNGE